MTGQEEKQESRVTTSFNESLSSCEEETSRTSWRNMAQFFATSKSLKESRRDTLKRLCARYYLIALSKSHKTFYLRNLRFKLCRPAIRLASTKFCESDAQVNCDLIPRDLSINGQSKPAKNVSNADLFVSHCLIDHDEL